METFKIFKNIGIVLFATLMCINFTSCNNDNDPTKNTTKGKKLTKMVDEDDEEDTFLFTYDEKGRLIETKGINNDNGKAWVYCSYTWKDNTIDIVEITPSGYVCNYIWDIENGLVKNINGDENATLSYNNSKKLIFYEDEWDTTSFIWEEDKLSSFYTKGGNSFKWNEAFAYDNIPCKKDCFHPFLLRLNKEHWIEEYFLPFAHPELLGMQTTKLPTKLTSLIDNDFQTYKYEFDKNGYVSKIIITDDYGDTETYTLTWE